MDSVISPACPVMPGFARSAMNRKGAIQIPSMNVKSRVRIRFLGNWCRACIAIQSGANMAIAVEASRAAVRAACQALDGDPKATPSAVTTTLTKTRP